MKTGSFLYRVSLFLAMLAILFLGRGLGVAFGFISEPRSPGSFPSLRKSARLFGGGALASICDRTLSCAGGELRVYTDGSFEVAPNNNGKFQVTGFNELVGIGAPGLSPAGRARFYFDSGTNLLMVSLNGAAYSQVATGAAIIIGSGANGQVTLWNGAQSQTGDAGFTFANTGPTFDLTLGRNITSTNGKVVLSSNTAVYQIGSNQFGYTNATGPNFFDATRNFSLTFNVQNLSANRTKTWVDTAGTVIEASAALANGQIPIGNTGNVPTAAAPTGADDISVTPGAGSLTVGRNTHSGTGYIIWPRLIQSGESQSSNVTMGAVNQVRVFRMRLDYKQTVTRIMFAAAQTGGATAGVGIYSEDGNTKLIDSGAITVASPGIMTSTFTAVTLTPGFYWLAWTSASQTVNLLRGITIDASFGTSYFSFSSTQFNAGTAANAGVSGVLPATLGTITFDASINGLSCPIVMLQG